MGKNKKQSILFYEDTTNLKRIYFILTILLYLGFIFGVCIIIIYRIISLDSLLAYYQPSGEDIIVTIFCLLFGIMFNIMILKSERFNYSIEITKNEIKFFSKGKTYTYITSDLVEYKIIRKYALYKEYVLFFTNERKVMIITKKEQELKNSLNTLISKKV